MQQKDNRQTKKMNKEKKKMHEKPGYAENRWRDVIVAFDSAGWCIVPSDRQKLKGLEKSLSCSELVCLCSTFNIVIEHM